MVARVLHNYNKKIYLFIAPTSINSHMHLTHIQKFFNFYNYKIKEHFTLKTTTCNKVSYSANAFLEYE